MRNIIKKLLRESLISEITSDEAWEKVYSNSQKFPELKGNKQIFDRLDALYPKKNNQFNRGYFQFLYNLIKNNKLRDEDFYKAKEYLELFDKHFSKIPKEKRNIIQYNTLPDLYDVVANFVGKTDDELQSKTQELKAIKEKEIDRLYEDDQWKVLSPKTERASCLVGKGTQWCTAADKSNNRFDAYNSRGKLYVLINKNDDSKYQIHFEDGELMNARNRPLSATYFFEYVAEDNALTDWFQQEREDFWDFILKTSAEDAADGGYSELFYEALNNGSDYERGEALDVLRGSDDEYAAFEGFIYEKDSTNIKDWQLTQYIEHFNDSERFEQVIEHLTNIGVDFDNVEDGKIKVILQGFEDLKKHKLETHKDYKIDKRRKLEIVGVNSEEDFPRYHIKINKTEGLVPLEKLLSYLHNRSLFERKEFTRKLLRENLDKTITCEKCGWHWKHSEGGADMYFCHKCGHDNTPDNINEAAKQISDLPEDTALFVNDNGNWLFLILYSKSEDKIYGTITTSNIYESGKIQETNRVAAEKGYGPLIYEMAMSYVAPNYLMPSRDGDIRGEAWNVWEKFYDRQDITKKTLPIENDLFSFSIVTGDENNFDSVEEKQEMFDSLDELEKKSVLTFNTMYKYENQNITSLINKAEEISKDQSFSINDLKHKAVDYFQGKYS